MESSSYGSRDLAAILPGWSLELRTRSAVQLAVVSTSSGRLDGQSSPISARRIRRGEHSARRDAVGILHPYNVESISFTTSKAGGKDRLAHSSCSNLTYSVC